jgi:hypothetical protein
MQAPTKISDYDITATCFSNNLRYVFVPHFCDSRCRVHVNAERELTDRFGVETWWQCTGDEQTIMTNNYCADYTFCWPM